MLAITGDERFATQANGGGQHRTVFRLEPFQFDTVYSHFFDRFIESGAKQILQASVDRYVAAVEGAYDRN